MEEGAFREFFELYLGRLRRYALVLARGDEASAQDAVQGAMLRLVRHIRMFQDEAAFWSWLTVLVRSALADERRKGRRYLGFLSRFSRELPPEPGPTDGESEQRWQEALDRTLAGLEPEERELLDRKYFQHLSVREIAGRSGETEKAVESKLARVRLKARTAILATLNHERR